MKVRGPGFPTEDEIYWEDSAIRVGPNGVEFRHISITKESASALLAEHGEERLQHYIRLGESRLQAWRNGCDGAVS
jgi:hypothetical protein